MQTAHNTAPLTFQGQPYQIYADLAQSTLMKRRDLRLHQHVLNEAHIKYRWGFPFKLSFQHQGQTHSIAAEADNCFQYLGLPLPPPRAPPAQRGKHPQPTSVRHPLHPPRTPISQEPEPYSLQAAHAGFQTGRQKLTVQHQTLWNC